MFAHNDVIGDAQHVDTGVFRLAGDIDHIREIAAYQPLDPEEADRQFYHDKSLRLSNRNRQV
jgi:hypothetical protein